MRDFERIAAKMDHIRLLEVVSKSVRVLGGDFDYRW